MGCGSGGGQKAAERVAGEVGDPGAIREAAHEEGERWTDEAEHFPHVSVRSRK